MEIPEIKTLSTTFSTSFGTVIKSPRTPRAETTFLNNRDKLRHKITNLYKTQFDYIDPTSIKFLELEARRGRTLIPGDSSYTPKAVKAKDPLFLNIKREHKNKHEGTQIVMLPKSPFGVHQKYDEKGFINNHFVAPESNDPKLFEFSKKMRIWQKRLRKSQEIRDKRAISPKRLCLRPKVDIYKTKAGDLICERHSSVVNAYEEENEKFKKFNRGVSEDAVKRRLMINDDKKKLEELKIGISKTIERLYTAPRNETRSTFYSSVCDKYPALFTEEDQY
ncbi:unnamed protein product [Blepharisma stoltei]|uniref:Uncharacterized protein n=1 Tax=Blepharisma stoltei TaxID=1481888 RepID=A0AAU9KAX3_9CILI|nr:unnamed protein product [Blepharisma stoltei]